jgi:hypothetical protein
VFKVFITLTALNLPSFWEDNWRSTIRGELARSTRFAEISNWVGRETADIVYKDEDFCGSSAVQGNEVGF